MTWKSAARVGLLLLGLASSAGECFAGAERILGKWKVTIESAPATSAVDLELKLDGSTLSGSTAQGAVTSVEFNDPYVTLSVRLENSSYLLKGVLKEGGLTGRWEAPGGAAGFWSGRRILASGNGWIYGTWSVVVMLPNQDHSFVLQLTREGKQISGTMCVSGGGGVTIEAASFRNNRLEFTVRVLGGSYRFEGTINEGRLTGEWFAKGPFVADRIN